MSAKENTNVGAFPSNKEEGNGAASVTAHCTPSGEPASRERVWPALAWHSGDQGSSSRRLLFSHGHASDRGGAPRRPPGPKPRPIVSGPDSAAEQAASAVDQPTSVAEQDEFPQGQAPQTPVRGGPQPTVPRKPFATASLTFSLLSLGAVTNMLAPSRRSFNRPSSWQSEF